MNIGYILPMSMVMGFISYSLMAKWYVMPWARQKSLSEALTPLLLLHSFRFIGMSFLIEEAEVRNMLTGCAGMVIT